MSSLECKCGTDFCFNKSLQEVRFGGGGRREEKTKKQVQQPLPPTEVSREQHIYLISTLSQININPKLDCNLYILRSYTSAPTTL